MPGTGAEVDAARDRGEAEHDRETAEASAREVLGDVVDGVGRSRASIDRAAGGRQRHRHHVGERHDERRRGGEVGRGRGEARPEERRADDVDVGGGGRGVVRPDHRHVARGRVDLVLERRRIRRAEGVDAVPGDIDGRADLFPLDLATTDRGRVPVAPGVEGEACRGGDASAAGDGAGGIRGAAAVSTPFEATDQVVTTPTPAASPGSPG
jgi:hypothetical protein